MSYINTTGINETSINFLIKAKKSTYANSNIEKSDYIWIVKL